MKNKDDLFVPSSGIKHSTLKIGDIVILNREAIKYCFVGKYSIVSRTEYDPMELKNFFILEACLSKSLSHLANKRNVGPKNKYKQNARESTFFLEMKDMASYFLSYDEEIRAVFKQEDALFIPIAQTEDIARDNEYPSPIKMMQTLLSNYFKSKDSLKRNDIYPNEINLGSNIFDYGGFICLPGEEYNYSSPDSIRGQIIAIWKMNKEVDMTERKGQNVRRFNAEALKPFKFIESIQMNVIVQTPINMLIACVEWFGYPSHFQMNIPLYVLMRYDAIGKRHTSNTS